MKIYIPVHSVVDVITNSSSVIYTEATTNAVSTMKEIINSILKLAGSEKTAEDLYDISIQKLPAGGLVDWLLCEGHDLIDDGEENVPTNIVEIVKQTDSLESKDYMTRRTFAEQLIQTHEAELLTYFTTLSEDDYYYDRPMFLDNLVIKTKDGVDTTFALKILSMFYSYEGER